MITDELELKIKELTYTYSDPIFIKRWASGHIAVKVGYVIKHPERNCVLLEKNWKVAGGGYKTQMFNVKDGNDWIKIKEAVEQLWPEIGETPTQIDIDRAISKVSRETDLLELLSKYPDLLSKIPNDVDILALPENQKESFRRLLAVGGAIADSVMRKLAEQPIVDIEQFVRILDQLKLSTINSLVTHITSRINFINMFEKAIHNDSSYERRGPESIHNLLKLNIWIVNRNYSVLHNDETLRTIIVKQWEEKLTDRDDLDRRLDFLCMVDPLEEERGYKTLVIIEIKRPNIKIEMKHVEQIMDYKTILQKHSGKMFKEFKCYLIGREIQENLKGNDLSNSGYIIKTYTDFISEARRFYREYLRIIEEEHLAF